MTLMPTLTVLKDTLSIEDTSFVSMYTFSCGHQVPIYEAKTMYALTRIIGHAKFNNKDYGSVFYRGQCKLYDTLIPSLIRNEDIERGPITVQRATERIKQQLRKMISDSKFPHELKIDGDCEEIKELKTEAVLQHYGAPTRFLDLVDNHWIALWMGLNRFEIIKNYLTYCRYRERTITYVDSVLTDVSEDELYQYILLIALPNGNVVTSGIYESNEYVIMDLRQALPSIFLRPHAQHAIVAKVRKNKTEFGKKYYDMSKNVVGIIKIRVDRVHDWIGSGELLTQDSLFPPAAYDYGYDILLTRNDLFDETFKIARYV